MPQAALIPIFTAIGLTGAALTAAVLFAQVVLINVGLGGFAYRDEDGDLWVAGDG